MSTNYEKMGADPEFLIVDRSGNPLPAHLLGIPDKTAPLASCDHAGKPMSTYDTRPYADNHTCYGRFHRDGFNVEINPIPATCRETLMSSVRGTLLYIQKNVLPEGFSLRPVSSFDIDLGILDDAPPDVQEFGCEPSFDAYSGGSLKFCPLNGRTHPKRYCGGHMHFSPGLREEGQFLRDSTEHPQFIKELDRYLGVVLAYLYASPTQWERRQWYGQAGEYRTQNYGDEIGVEYRTPPAEMWAHPFTISLAYLLARWVITNHVDLKNKWDRGYDDIVARAINTGEGLDTLLPTIPELNLSPKVFRNIREADRLNEFLLAGREGGTAIMASAEYINHGGKTVWQ